MMTQGPGQLPPGCIQCPQCGFIGAPVVRGRAKTGFAVASSLLFLPLGILHLAANKGELACPQCGLGMGSAAFFSNHERADGPSRGPALSPGAGHRLHPWSAPSPQQYPPQYQQQYQQPHAQQGPSAAETNGRIGAILLGGVVLIAGLCVIAMAATKADPPSTGQLTAPQFVAPPQVAPAAPETRERSAQRHRRRSATRPERRDVDPSEVAGSPPPDRTADPSPEAERTASVDEALDASVAGARRHRRHRRH